MPFKRELNAELKRLRDQAKALEKTRAELTKEVDAELQENSEQQEALQSYMTMRFGKQAEKKPTRGRPKKVVARKGVRGKRKDRSDVRPRVLAIIGANIAGIRRKAILAEMGLENDPAGKQYVSNTIRDLRDEGLLRAVGRQYFPAGAGGGESVSDSGGSEETTSTTTSTPEPSATVSDSGFGGGGGGESSGGEPDTGSSSGSPSF